jgi:hypothetical protein
VQPHLAGTLLYLPLSLQVLNRFKIRVRLRSLRRQASSATGAVAAAVAALSDLDVPAPADLVCAAWSTPQDSPKIKFCAGCGVKFMSANAQAKATQRETGMQRIQQVRGVSGRRRRRREGEIDVL